jgi:ABC-type transport system involved in cytochrome c biogenesis ATPase subunit
LADEQKLIDALNQIGLQGYEDEYCGKLSAPNNTSSNV